MRRRADACPWSVRALHVLVVITFAAGYASLCAATTLPVGPITFSSNADYDNNFKEAPPPLHEILRNAGGYLELLRPPITGSGIAVFDTSATGGRNGQGGTGGRDANGDLANFTISADVASSVDAGIGVGFLLRLDENERNGYAAGAHFFPPFTARPGHVAFDIFEGAGFTEPGSRIFHQEVPVASAPLANTFYSFKLSCFGGTFAFDFGNGAATARFTDPTVTATKGQAGLVLDVASPFVATRLDNLTISSEPLIGDFDANGVLDAGDIDQLAACTRNHCQVPRFDLNSDARIDDGDHRIWVKDLAQTWYGDADLNGEFDSNDFVRVFQVGKYETQQDARWAEGDWNGDGIFNSVDFITAFQDGGYERGPRTHAAAVPEPGTAFAMIASLAVVAACCRSRKQRD